MKASRSRWLFALVPAALLAVVLGPARAFAGSHDVADAATGMRLRGNTRMAKEMDALHAEMRRLKSQLDRIAQVTAPSARQELIREHLLSVRQAITRLYATELQMIEDVDKGRIVFDRDLASRQRMLAELTAMALDMLDRGTSCETASGR